MTDARRPFIKFERLAIEDRAQTAATGVYMVRDAEFIIIIPHGSEGKTELREEYGFWLDKMKRQIGPVRAAGSDAGTPFIMDSRFPKDWLDEIEKGYAAWKKGEELPVEGTPLKQWAVLPPAMLQNCIAQNIFTIEQLAGASDEAINPVGMGARLFRNQAQDWLKLNKESERNKMVTQLAQLSSDNAKLTEQVAQMTVAMAELMRRLPNTDPTTVMQQHVSKKAA
jgi:hypothetical protein